MGDYERLHRPDLERSEPRRNAANYLRDPTAAAEDLGRSDAERHPEDVVAYGVRLGYQVIEEQIRKGQQLAQRLRPGTATGSDDLGALVGRVLHLYKDFGALCFDAVDVLGRGAAARSAAPGAGEARQEEMPRPGTNASSVYGIEVCSPFRTQVMLNFTDGSRNIVPRAHTLHASDPNICPLAGVSFKTPPASLVPTLLIEIVDAQCPATYTGVIVDELTNEPCGTLCIRLSA
jgi:hypothetical protein